MRKKNKVEQVKEKERSKRINKENQQDDCSGGINLPLL